MGIDLKHPEAVEFVLRLVEQADGLVEGFRPGVADVSVWVPMPAGPRTPPWSTGA